MLADCSPPIHRCLNFADDNGNLPRSAKQLKAQVFLYDDLNCEPNVQELITNDLIAEYEVTGVKYLHTKNFLKHQKIDRPSKCTISLPLLDADSPSTTRARAPEWNREEGKEGMGSSSSRGDMAEKDGHRRSGRRWPVYGVKNWKTYQHYKKRIRRGLNCIGPR